MNNMEALYTLKYSYKNEKDLIKSIKLFKNRKINFQLLSVDEKSDFITFTSEKSDIIINNFIINNHLKGNLELINIEYFEWRPWPADGVLIE